MNIAEDGLWLFDGIDVRHGPITEPGHVATVVGYGKRYRRTPGDGPGMWEEGTHEVACKSHPEVLRAVQQMLTHTDWWGIA